MGSYNAWVRKHLIAWMEKNQLPAESISAFSNRWTKLEHLDKLLRPNCFMLDGAEKPIGSLAAQGNIEPLICPHCRTQYDIPKG